MVMVTPISTLSRLFLALSFLLTTVNVAADRSAEDSNLLQYASVSSSPASTLSVIDITIEAPHRPFTCEAAVVQWNWDLDGSLPDDPIALSIINSTDLSTFRRRSSNRHFDYHSNVALRKRAANGAVALPGATNVPFDRGYFEWDVVGVAPGRYRLLLTIVDTNDSVVSDPFEVSRGDNDSCLGSDATSSDTASSTASGTTSASNTASTDDTGDEDEGSSDQSVSSSVITQPTETTSSSSSDSDDGDNNSQSSAGSLSASKQQGEHSSNTGAVIAGVLVPLLFIIGGAIAFFWRRKREASSHNPEKTVGDDSQDKWYRRLFAPAISSGANTQHRRQISGPEMATAAGLASVASLVPAVLRTEKDEAALQRAGAAGNRRPRSRRGTTDSEDSSRDSEHWVDFGADDTHNIDGARPLSPNTIDSQSFSVIGGNQQLYAQGQNVHLSSQWSSEASEARESASSGMSRSSIATFSTTSNIIAGRDLLATVPLARSISKSGTSTGVSASTAPASADSSSSSSSPFGDEHAATVPTTATSVGDNEATTAHQMSIPRENAKLERSDSAGSQFGIKRKPVPRFSGAPRTVVPNLPGQSALVEADPFSNANAIPDSRSSVEILRTPNEGPSAPATPPQPPFKFHAATPSSIPETAFSDTMSTRSRHTLDLPSSVTEDSLATLTSNGRPGAQSEEGGESNLYHLSINLGSEGGFRMSFD